MIFIKRFIIFYIFYIFLLLKSNSNESSVVSSISLPESYVSKKNTSEKKTIIQTKNTLHSGKIKKQTKNTNKIILGAIGIIIIGGIIYFIKSN